MPNPTKVPVAAALEARLPLAMARDASRLKSKIERASARRAPEAEWSGLSADLERSIAKCRARAAAKPAFTYPPDLPVAQRADEISRAIREHPVVIVCGETGSGKTTQLPKICLAAGRGERGLIGHTQPRRIAARAVAARIAQEMGQAVGEAVGYKVRFTDHTRPDAYIKLMTDGILLAETQGDRLLEAYDTIIVDEAHERSLNIDFLLGYLKQLLRKRPDLKVIITSATLDADRFARHFGTDGNLAPVIEVSGRMFPVDVRFRPLKKVPGPGAAAMVDEADDEEELEEAIVSTAEELWREAPGDILVFLPGEREIRETGDLLRRGLARRPYAAQVEILPLFARLSVAEQQRIFAPGNGRRIVLATNVAETSLTVPGIRYVIDAGLARVKRYSLRNKTTLLQIEKVSQSAANQRAGRCGRVADGVCVRLYGDDDFAARPKFTDPEILRSSLAAVILRMASLELGAVDAFPFVEPPGPRAIADGYQLLQELGAVDDARDLTPLGRELARLPLDPRIGRIVLAARDLGCLPEALVIASALAVPDPRERPLERQQAADQAHLRFRDDRSDFLSLVALWEFFSDALGQKLSHRRLVDACRAQFVSWLRLREWRDVHQQLVAALEEAGWKWSAEIPSGKDALGSEDSARSATRDSARSSALEAARYVKLHKAVLAGLLGNIGVKADGEDYYLGARGLKFYLHPGSGLAKKGSGASSGGRNAGGGSTRWLLAAELTETSRLFARCAAKVEPEWIEEVAGERVTRDYFEPHWEEKRGEVVASERVSLYGLTLVARRAVSYGAINPEISRDVFIREALVTGALASRGAFIAHNRQLVAEVAELEHKARRQDVLVDDETIATFYAEQLPAHIHSLVAFERWRTGAEATNPQVLFLTRGYLMRHAAALVTVELFPSELELAGTRLPLKYRFTPEHPLDGLTLRAPLSLLNQLDDARLSWLVPGMVREKVTYFLKALPKAWRNRLIPLPETVTAFLESALALPVDPAVPLPQALRGYLRERLGESPPVDVWDDAEVPAHLLVNVQVVDAAGDELAMGRDLAQLRVQLGEAAQMSFAASGTTFEKKGMRRWDFGDLPLTLAIQRGSQQLTGYPALVDEGDSVALAMLDTRDAADASTRAGILRLLRIALKDAAARFDKGGPVFTQAALLLKTTIPTDRLLKDVLAAITDRAFLGDDALPRNEQAFAEQVKRARTRLPAVAEGAFRLLGSIAAEQAALTQRLAELNSGHSRLGAEVRAQRDALVYPGFFAGTPWPQLAHLPRYFKALDRRLAKFAERPERDAKHAEQVALHWQRYRERLDRNRVSGRIEPALEDFRWLLEELRVSLFAQELKTPVPVSFKRVERVWAELSR
ncbi:MAG: ATP-dependent RNA helicase HrpA [Betaproteobacteria bacterium]